MVCNDNLLTERRRVNKRIYVGLPDGTIRTVKEMGTVILGSKLILKHVLYIPEFKHNLLSLARFMEQTKLDIIFSDQKCGGIFELDATVQQTRKGEKKTVVMDYNNVSLEKKTKANVMLMHQRLEHTSLSKLKHITKCDCNGLNEIFCDTCCVSKHIRLPFPISKSIAEHAFDLVHVDLWGPYKVQSLSGGRYFLTILDDYSRVTWTHLISNKTQVKTVIGNFFTYIKNHFKREVKTIRSDNGIEVVQVECGEIFSKKGIVHQISAPKTPQ
ncbi:Retrovirus-related Pol polyprotein from transposon TNT 1-94 [Bienertia sinuspersici]